MGITTIFRVLIQLLAGVGIAEFMDKFLPGKAPQYTSVSPGFKPMKLAYFLGAFGIGAVAWNFVNRKFHIITRRHAPKRRTRKSKRS